MRKKLVVLGISILPLWFDSKVKAGMPSVYLGLKGYVEHGHEIHYITLGKKGELPEENIDGIVIHRYFIPFIKISQKRILNTITRYFLWIMTIIYSFKLGFSISRKIQPNVFYGHTYYGVPSAYLLSKLFKVPYVYRAYGSMDLNEQLETILGRIRHINEIIAMKIPADIYIFTNDGSETDKAAIKLNVNKEKIKFWRNGIFKIITNEKIRSQIRTELKLKNDQIMCVTAARLVPNKYIGEILEAIKILNNNSIVLFILGDGEIKSDLEKKAIKLEIENRVHFLGAVSREFVSNYFMASDIVLALGSYNPILEGMTLGKPVICLELGATKDLIENGKNGILLDSPNSAEIAEAIKILASDEKLRSYLSVEAEKSIHKNYLFWDDRIEAEINLIADLVENRVK